MDWDVNSILLALQGIVLLAIAAGYLILGLRRETPPETWTPVKVALGFGSFWLATALSFAEKGDHHPIGLLRWGQVSSLATYIGCSVILLTLFLAMARSNKGLGPTTWPPFVIATIAGLAVFCI